MRLLDSSSLCCMRGLGCAGRQLRSVEVLLKHQLLQPITEARQLDGVAPPTEQAASIGGSCPLRCTLIANRRAQAVAGLDGEERPLHRALVNHCQSVDIAATGPPFEL